MQEPGQCLFKYRFYLTMQDRMQMVVQLDDVKGGTNLYSRFNDTISRVSNRYAG